jgi:hypothetical protein
MQDEEWARVHLYNSVMGSEDFARYIIGTNFGHFEWSSCRLGEPRRPARKEIYKVFVKSLKGKQKEAWERFHTIRVNVDFYRRFDQLEKTEVFKREFSKEELEGTIAGSEQVLRKTLGRKNLRLFEEYVIPYLDDPHPHKDEYRFDLSIAQRWILKRVFDLGWTTERFGKFDREVNRDWGYGRGSRKPERIGKKYQWIAYHEFLARVADTFEFRGDSLSNRTEKYEGTYQVSYVRDIDPSCLLGGTKRQEWEPHTTTWWFPSLYDSWDSETNDVKWLKNFRDLPAIRPLIEVTNPKNGSKWLVMEAYYQWEQPTATGEDRFEIQRREFWYMLNSYIVRKSDVDELFEWAKKRDFMGRWMPESHETTRVFLGEFFWAPAFKYHNIPYYNHVGWTRGQSKRVPKEVLVSTDQYMHEYSGYDCSISKTINIYLLAKWVADNMGLRWNGVEGHFFNDKGDLIAFDPSIETSGPGALLIKRDAFRKFLNDNGYDVLWTILGEKNLIGGHLSHENWKGRLELSGAYRIRENRIEGAINTRFHSRD